MSEEYPQILRNKWHSRAGQRCKILGFGTNQAIVQVEFEDGFKAVVAKNLLRRPKPAKNSMDGMMPSESKLPANLKLHEGE